MTRGRVEPNASSAHWSPLPLEESAPTAPTRASAGCGSATPTSNAPKRSSFVSAVQYSQNAARRRVRGVNHSGFTARAISPAEIGAVSVATDPAVDMNTQPVTQVSRMSGAEYFTYAAELMKLHPPHVTDWSILERMRRIGVEPSKSLDVYALDPATREALDQAAPAGLRAIEAKIPQLAPLINGCSRDDGCLWESLPQAGRVGDDWAGLQPAGGRDLPVGLR